MLALVTLFLLTFLIAAGVIWIYRLVFGVQNYTGSTVAKKRGGNSIKLGAQQGYFSLKRKTAKRSQAKSSRTSSSRTLKAQPKLSAASGKNKVPWGW